MRADFSGLMFDLRALMKISPIVFLAAFVLPLSAVPVFIGTNTGSHTQSKGIYQADFDPQTGRLTVPTLAVEYSSPGFLALHPDKPVLLAVGRATKPFADGSASVAAFAIGNDKSLKFLGEASSGGKGACHLAVNSSGTVVAVANYGDGSIAQVSLDKDGVPVSVLHSQKHIGKGPNAKRQEGPHAHGVYFDRSEKYLFVPDLGLDRVHVEKLGAKFDDFTEPWEPLRTAAGAGPRHMAFSPDEKHAYVINELDSTILAASYRNGEFTPVSTVSTLPDGFSGNNTTAEVEVSEDGRFVYGSNRGHDSLAVFSRDPKSGGLSLIQVAPCGGKTPRHFKIAPGGKWLLCAHMESDSISVLPIDPSTGRLAPPVKTVATPSPICILFGRLAS
jgi:6-phosphogluconolactonase